MGRIRGDVPEPFTGHPAIGAYHRVNPNGSLGRFMGDLCEIADEVFQRPFGTIEIDSPSPHLPEVDFEPIQIVEPEGEVDEYDPDRFYSAYNVARMWVSVLDGHQSERFARKLRRVWEGQDIGSTEQIARDAIDKVMPLGELPLVFDQVVRVGARLPNAPGNHEGRKLALIPSPGECAETQEYLGQAHEIVVEAIQRRMRDFVPYGSYIPHMTVAWFGNGVEEDQIADVATEAKGLVAQRPVRATLERPIKFRDRLVRDPR